MSTSNTEEIIISHVQQFSNLKLAVRCWLLIPSGLSQNLSLVCRAAPRRIGAGQSKKTEVFWQTSLATPVILNYTPHKIMYQAVSSCNIYLQIKQQQLFTYNAIILKTEWFNIIPINGYWSRRGPIIST